MPRHHTLPPHKSRSLKLHMKPRCAPAHVHAIYKHVLNGRSDTLLAAEGGKDAKGQYAAGVVAEDATATAVSTYDCPVCRRAQILDLDRLQAGTLRDPKTLNPC
jgi:hypothetical protein